MFDTGGSEPLFFLMIGNIASLRRHPEAAQKFGVAELETGRNCLLSVVSNLVLTKKQTQTQKWRRGKSRIRNIQIFVLQPHPVSVGRCMVARKD
jgi:hypothetical protein